MVLVLSFVLCACSKGSSAYEDTDAVGDGGEVSFESETYNDADSYHFESPDIQSSEEGENESAETTLKPGDAELIQDIYGDSGDYPYITLKADKESVLPGDKLNVTLAINNSENLACFDIRLTYDTSVLSLAEYEEASIDDFYFETSEVEAGILFSGFTARTSDFDGEDVITFTFDVSAEAAEGFDINANASQFMIGTDDGGDVIADLTDVVEVSAKLSLSIG